MIDAGKCRLLKKLQRQARRARQKEMVLLNTAELAARRSLAEGHKLWLTKRRRDELTRWLAHYDQTIALIDGILSGALPEDTELPPPPPDEPEG
jgi:hypothetical protein